MRSLVVVLAAGAACGRAGVAEQPGRSAYGIVTPQTSITISDDFVSDIMSRDHRVVISGDGTLRDEVGGSREAFHVSRGHLSQAELVRLLNELAAIDFLNMQCTEPYQFQVDHGAHPEVQLSVPAGERFVRLDDCGDHYAELATIVSDVEKIAARATAH